MEGSSNRHKTGCAAAIVSLGSLIIAACSSAPGGPAPVYMMGMAGTAMNEPAAAVPVEPSMAPVALANWSDPSGSAARTGPDVIPLDDPPQPASASIASATPAAAPPPPVAPPVASTATASAQQEPSAAEEARAEAAPPPVREPAASKPARGDLVTAGANVPRPASYSRSSYYWP